MSKKDRHGTLFIMGYVESFNNILRDELLNAEIFLDVPDAKAHARRWRNKCNHSHSSLGYVPPAPEPRNEIFDFVFFRGKTTPLGLASLTLPPFLLNTF